MTKAEARIPEKEKSLKTLFKKIFGREAEFFVKLKGDGSAREIYRLSSGEKSAVGIYGPDRKENRAFLEFSRHFGNIGLPVPEIYAEDEMGKVYIEEDLGEHTLFDKIKEERKKKGAFGPKSEKLYMEAIKFLPLFQTKAIRGLNLKYCHPRKKFDKQSILWDMNYFKYYFLKLGKIPFDEQKLEKDFDSFSDLLLRAPGNFLIYRDFQSRNIMINDSGPHFIDYQGARKGALQYDVASLLYDAKADIPYKTREKLLDFYLSELSGHIKFSREKFMTFYPAYAYVRIMQAMGAYGLRGFYEGKSHFLESIPYAVQNIEYLLTHYPLPVKVPELTRVFKRIAASSKLRQFGKVRLGLTVRIQSFSYKKGIPRDERGHGGGYVFDCRTLPNPGRFSRYSGLTGKDRETAAYLERKEDVRKFMKSALALCRQSIENYKRRNFTDLMVSFGCTGGRHRSVYCAEKMKELLSRIKGLNIEIIHREIEEE